MELSEITAALEGNSELLTGLTSHILGTDKGQEIIGNKAQTIFDGRISEEISGVHSQYDTDMFEILGEKPKALEGGAKQKTYDKVKELYAELKELRGQKEGLTKDAEVQRLTSQIEKLKTEGGGAHWEKTFNTEAEKWKSERQALIERAEQAENNIITFQKRQDIEVGLRSLKFNDKVPDDARKALVDAAVKGLVDRSKVEDGKIIYLDENGSAINNEEYKPQSAENILKDTLKSILVNENTSSGGGADAVIKGSIKTNNVDGKNVKALELTQNSFKTKSEFIEVAEKAMLDSGMVRGEGDWDTLKTDAYNRYEVSKLPRQ